MNKVTFKAYNASEAHEAMNKMGEKLNVGRTTQSYISGRVVHIECSGNTVTAKGQLSQAAIERAAQEVIDEMGLQYAQ